jgi:hypothetical protein
MRAPSLLMLFVSARAGSCARNARLTVCKQPYVPNSKRRAAQQLFKLINRLIAALRPAVLAGQLSWTAAAVPAAISAHQPSCATPTLAATLQVVGLWSAAAAVTSAHTILQPHTPIDSSVQRRSLAQIIPDNLNPAVATRTTNTTAPGATPAEAGTAAGSDSNPAIAPRSTRETAPTSNTSADSNSTANPAVAPRTANETLPSASDSSTTQSTNTGQRGSIPLADCPAGQMAVGSQCAPSNAVEAASSGAALRASCGSRMLQWLASTALLAMLTVAA